MDNATAVDTNVRPRTRPAWCADETFVRALKDAQSRLWTSISGAGNSTSIPRAVGVHETAVSALTNIAEINTEVWSYAFNHDTNTFTIADLASLSPDGTESDAIQLWSYGLLGLANPLTNRTVEGFL